LAGAAQFDLTAPLVAEPFVAGSVVADPLLVDPLVADPLVAVDPAGVATFAGAGAAPVAAAGGEVAVAAAAGGVFVPFAGRPTSNMLVGRNDGPNRGSRRNGASFTASVAKYLRQSSSTEDGSRK